MTAGDTVSLGLVFCVTPPNGLTNSNTLKVPSGVVGDKEVKVSCCPSLAPVTSPDASPWGAGIMKVWPSEGGVREGGSSDPDPSLMGRMKRKGSFDVVSSSEKG